MALSLNEADVVRYARQIVLPEIGGVGQEKLLAGKVLVVGAGGLGSPLVLYLAAAGVGTIGVIDFDNVDESNLQRQIAFSTADCQSPKIEALKKRITALNPGIDFIGYEIKLDTDNVIPILQNYDIVADGCDNLSTRLIVHDAAMKAGIPLISGAVQGLDGQLTTYKSYLGSPHPCMRCLMDEMPDDDVLPSCAQGGILGSAAGVVGSLQATEVIKELLGYDGLSGKMMHYDALSCDFTPMHLPRRKACEAACVRLPVSSAV